MTTSHRSFAALAALALQQAACIEPVPFGVQPDGEDPVDACAQPTRAVSREQSGGWCGHVTIDDDVVVPEGEELTVAAGTTVDVLSGARIRVDGTLTFAGTKEARIEVSSDGLWGGLVVTGRLEGEFVEISGFAGALVTTGSASVTLSDATLDLKQAVDGPDCTAIGGGTVTLDHVRFTGCHCPIHIDAADAFSATNSIFDEASDAVMIAETLATFSGNHFLGVDVLMLDIGSGSGIAASVGGNYWGGGPPDIGTPNAAQFQDADDYSSTPFDDVGPRF